MVHKIVYQILQEIIDKILTDKSDLIGDCENYSPDSIQAIKLECRKSYRKKT